MNSKKPRRKLLRGDLSRFGTWFEAFDVECFDAKIERDVRSGKLDGLAEEAVADYRAGKAREL